MITFLRTWANQIIVAVIIATIFEMLLPNGNNKKYIKMIIGLYVLFTIIQPIITKITGSTFDISTFNYKKYFDENSIQTTVQDFENNNSKLIEQAYINNIKSDIQTKLKQKGYKVSSCNIEIVKSKNEEEYGIIEKITLNIEKVNKTVKENDSNTINVESVDISIGNSSIKSNIISFNKNKEDEISNKEKLEIIEYLSNEYSVSKEKIYINK